MRYAKGILQVLGAGSMRITRVYHTEIQVVADASRIYIPAVTILVACLVVGCVQEATDLSNNKTEGYDSKNHKEGRKPRIVEIGDTINDVGSECHNMSMILLSWEEGGFAVWREPLLGILHYTCIARAGRKFIVLTYRFQNNWVSPQRTPELRKANITTNKGHVYYQWDPSSCDSAEVSTKEEIARYIGDSAAFEELFPREKSSKGCLVFEIAADEQPGLIAIGDVPAIIRLNSP